MLPGNLLTMLPPPAAWPFSWLTVRLVVGPASLFVIIKLYVPAWERCSHAPYTYGRGVGAVKVKSFWEKSKHRREREREVTVKIVATVFADA